MLYFAFGSNLYKKQMKRRCKDSKYICCHKLKNYKLVFRHFFLGGGVADVERKKNSTVLGAIYEISKQDEKKLDVYEDFPNHNFNFFKHSTILFIFFLSKLGYIGKENILLEIFSVIG